MDKFKKSKPVLKNGLVQMEPADDDYGVWCHIYDVTEALNKLKCCGNCKWMTPVMGGYSCLESIKIVGRFFKACEDWELVEE